MQKTFAELVAAGDMEAWVPDPMLQRDLDMSIMSLSRSRKAGQWPQGFLYRGRRYTLLGEVLEARRSIADQCATAKKSTPIMRARAQNQPQAAE